MAGSRRSTAHQDRKDRELLRHLSRHYDLGNGNPRPDPFECVPLTLEEGSFRHGHWGARRAKIFRALQLAGTGRRQLERFDTCGSQARVFYSPTQQKYAVRASYCKCRHCEPCMRAKAATIAGNLRRRLAERPIGRYRFVTLTLAHTDAPLPDQVKRLLASFRKLRRSKIWKTQHGGCYVLEIKIGRDDRWHPHLHVISEGNFLPQAQLSDAWHDITGDSFQVDVRAISNFENVTHELTKYVTKSTSGDVWEDDQLAIEWVVAARGTRSCATFGSWRQFKLTERPPDPGDWVHVGTLTDVVRAAARREAWAVGVILNLRPPGLRDDTS